MRVIHVSEAFGGGLRTAIVNYITATPEHEHTIFARARIGHETLAVPDTVTGVYFDGSLVGFLKAAREAVLGNDYDLVHLHSSYAGLVRALLPAHSRIVYSPHCYAMESDHSPMKRLAYSFVERLLAQRNQMLLAVSRREAEIGIRLRPDMPSRTVPNATLPLPDPLVLGTGSSVAAGNASTTPVITMLGRICDQKDPRFFAAVASILGSDYRYRWIGDGDEGRRELEDAGVEITGWVTPERTIELLSTSSLYAHTAAWEGAPLSTLEAAAVDCPVIARRIPSMATLGYPLGGATPSEMASSIRRYFSDQDYRGEVTAGTREIRVRYSFAAMARSLRDAYDFAYEVSEPNREEQVR